jgi:Mg2+ and Co2+ transporter CorA
VDVWLMTDAGAEQYPAASLESLLAGDEGFVWVDIPGCDDAATDVLAKTFGFHPLAVRDCVERNRLSKLHTYDDHLFIVLHAPERGERGHVHYIELDQFIGPRYLVTVHGPVNPVVDPVVTRRETDSVLARVKAGRLRPRSPFELSHAIVSTLTRCQEEFVERLTGEVWRLEQWVTAGHVGDPERQLDELFQARHGLLAVRTMAALSREVYGRLATLGHLVPPAAGPLTDDLADQFDRIRNLADSQREYLQGVIEFYRTRTETKMTIAAERFAVIAAITLPITALSSVLGMNLIVNDHTQALQLVIVLAVMVAMSGTLLYWARRRGWW